ncbi:MAG: S1/P1 nuclease [Muribaculaceae bacterium]|nr:S1/P1 nuclease [Muribaculaceae bacterium]
MINKKFLFSLSLATLTAIQGFSWGQKGHDTVAFIAESHLTETTKQAIDSILNGKSIVYYSNWLDNASHTPEYAYTKTWHYKNIDPDETFENAPLLDTGDVVRAINEQAAILNDPNSTADKALALKILVHLVGDIHQPMHMGRRNDRGGNSVRLKFFNSNTNLHSIWDTRVLESGHNWTYTEWKNQIDRATPEETAVILADGTPEKWGKECYLIASEIYDKTPADSNLSYDYVSEWTPVIETQLLRGGLRLADLLNSIYDPYYKGANLIVKK